MQTTQTELSRPQDLRLFTLITRLGILPQSVLLPSDTEVLKQQKQVIQKLRLCQYAGINVNAEVETVEGLTKLFAQVQGIWHLLRNPEWLAVSQEIDLAPDIRQSLVHASYAWHIPGYVRSMNQLGDIPMIDWLTAFTSLYRRIIDSSWAKKPLKEVSTVVRDSAIIESPHLLEFQQRHGVCHQLFDHVFLWQLYIRGGNAPKYMPRLLEHTCEHTYDPWVARREAEEFAKKFDHIPFVPVKRKDKKKSKKKAGAANEQPV